MMFEEPVLLGFPVTAAFDQTVIIVGNEGDERILGGIGGE